MREDGAGDERSGGEDHKRHVAIGLDADVGGAKGGVLELGQSGTVERGMKCIDYGGTHEVSVSERDGMVSGCNARVVQREGITAAGVRRILEIVGTIVAGKE